MEKRLFLTVIFTWFIMMNFVFTAEASTGMITDTFTDESMISVKNNVTVNTSDNNVELDSIGSESGSGIFYSTADDGHLIYQNADLYNEAHDASAATLLWPEGRYAYLYQNKMSTQYHIARIGLFFDTSSLPDAALITSANLNLFVELEPYGTPWDLVIVRGSDLNMPLEYADYGELLDEVTSLGSIPASDYSSGQYNIELNSAGLNEMSKTGITKLALRQDKDIEAIAPSGFEYVSIWMSEEGGDYRPTLQVDYTATAYATLGNIMSINLLSGLNILSIDSFDYNIFSLPSGSTTRVQFSQDNTNWYNASGILSGWDILSEGDNTIDLASLGWSGDNFYYNVQFYSDSFFSAGPVLDEISVNYSSGVIPEPASLLLLGFGVVGLGGFGRLKKKG